VIKKQEEGATEESTDEHVKREKVKTEHHTMYTPPEADKEERSRGRPTAVKSMPRPKANITPFTSSWEPLTNPIIIQPSPRVKEENHDSDADSERSEGFYTTHWASPEATQQSDLVISEDDYNWFMTPGEHRLAAVTGSWSFVKDEEGKNLDIIRLESTQETSKDYYLDNSWYNSATDEQISEDLWNTPEHESQFSLASLRRQTTPVKRKSRSSKKMC